MFRFISVFLISSAFGLPEPQFGLPDLKFGLPTSKLGLPEAKFGLPEAQFKLPEPPFGLPEPKLELPEPPFELPEPPFELPEPPFELPELPFELPEPPFELPELPFELPELPVELPGPEFDVDLVTLKCIIIEFVLDVVGKFIKTFTTFETLFHYTDVTFILWTREKNDFRVQYKNDSSLQKSSLDRSKKTYFITHGFTSNGYEDWVLDIKSKILSLEDANVFCVDMQKSLSLSYTNSVCNVYKIGNLTAHFIKWLKLDPSKVHIIGHSLGAHIAGLTGHYVKQVLPSEQIGRVSGLDPAGPLFYKIVNKKRLDKSQADFVDVMHTNGCDVPVVGCLGLRKAIGHKDFYPNGGVAQAGCFTQICSHGRAHDLYAESIVPESPMNKTFKSCPCTSWFSYKYGKCDNKDSTECLDMGFHISPNSKKTIFREFYLFTNAESPYALG